MGDVIVNGMGSRHRLLMSVALASLALVACGRGSEQDIAGTVTLRDSSGRFRVDQSTCSSYRGELKAGTQVVVRDGDGSTLGVGSLQSGSPGEAVGSTGRSYECVFEFYVNGADSSDYYQFVVGGIQGPTYSREEMEARDWQVGLSISE